VTVIGLTFAKACSQPGNVATGTNMELVKITGMTARSPPMPADSASRTTSPSSAKIQEKATPTAREADSGQRRARAGVEAEADRVPQAGHQHQYEQVAERVGGDGAGQDGAAGHRRARNWSVMPVAKSSASATPVCDAPNAMARTQMPGGA
jgi:hypothetical protein